VDALPDFGTLSDEQLDSLIRALEADEDAISRRRRLLHGRIDLLRAERVSRLSARVAEGDIDLPAPETLERPLFQGTGELTADAGELEAMPDFAALGDDELRAMIVELEHEEDDVSLQRRFLQGRVDILRAERARRQRGGRSGPAGTPGGGGQRGDEPEAHGPKAGGLDADGLDTDGLDTDGLADVLSGGRGGA